MGFWILVGLSIVVLLIWLLFPLLKKARSTGERRSSYDVQVFRDQLKEIDSDLTRGVLSQTEAGRSRTEISRRLLTAADAESTENAPDRAPVGVSRAMSGVIAVLIIAGSFGVYQSVGSQGMRDLPLEANLARANNRPTQAQAEAIIAEQEDSGELALPDISTGQERARELVGELQEAMITRPNDLQGHRILANSLAGIGKFSQARQAQDIVMQLLGEDATAEDYVTHAEIMILATNGYTSPEAFAALDKGYQLDARDPRLLYYLGLALAQEGQYGQTYNIWIGLLQRGPDDAPWIAPIEAQIADIAKAAGIEPTLRGPSQDDVNAAGQMSEEDRTAMIRNMVAGLDDRLTAEGGPIGEWLRLIGAYGVLDDLDNASRIFNLGMEAFKDQPDALEQLVDVGVAANVIER